MLFSYIKQNIRFELMNFHLPLSLFSLIKINYIFPLDPNPTEADEIISIACMGIYITSAPREVVCAPNLRQHCVNTFKHALQQDGTLVIFFN